MFAFGFYDSVERSLILARDRFGMKPLYLCEDSGRLLFTSENQGPATMVDADPRRILHQLLSARLRRTDEGRDVLPRCSFGRARQRGDLPDRRPARTGLLLRAS